MLDGPWESCMSVRGLNPSECASWVQAWGTILAIIAAGCIAVWQLRAHRVESVRARKEKLRAVLEVVTSLIRMLRLQVESREALLRPGSGFDDPRELGGRVPFSDLEATARSISVNDLADFETVRLMFDFLNLIRVCQEVDARLLARFHSVPGVFDRADHPFAMALEALETLGNQCESHASRLGVKVVSRHLGP